MCMHCGLSFGKGLVLVTGARSRVEPCGALPHVRHRKANCAMNSAGIKRGLEMCLVCDYQVLELLVITLFTLMLSLISR
jgi:hypothetical protein